MTRQGIRTQIEEAFAETPYPGDDFDAISATKNDEGIVEYFRGTTWRGHSATSLRCHSHALSFFTDAAYRFWLPAFMIAEIDDPREADVIAGAIVSELGVPGRRSLDMFSRDELTAIAAFLNRCKARAEAQGNERDEHYCRRAVKHVEQHLARV